MTTGTAINKSLLEAILDQLIPAIGEIPSAGQMGIADEIIRLAGQQNRFNSIFTNGLSAFDGEHQSFEAMSADDQVGAIKAFELAHAEYFDAILTIAYIVYYKDERVHNRIGWSGNTPQPDGNEMEPWDESILSNVRDRDPFWRRVD